MDQGPRLKNICKLKYAKLQSKSVAGTVLIAILLIVHHSQHILLDVTMIWMKSSDTPQSFP